MNNHPLISVIVPVYNAESFLVRGVRSLMEQSYPNLEIVLVDDGSTDGSPAICDELAGDDNRIYVVHQPNRGVSAARNAGISVARGKYLGFLDCDDRVKPHMFMKLVEAAEAAGCCMVMGGYDKVDADGNRTPVYLPYDGEVPGNTKEIMYSMAFWRGFLNGGRLAVLYGSAWPNLYRADIVREHHIRFSEGVVLGEDLLFNIDFLIHAKTVRMVSEPLYEYNVGNQSATRKSRPDLWSKYSLLLACTKKKLIAEFGGERELLTNIDRQYISFAVSVLEEQLCVFASPEELNGKISALCREQDLRSAAASLLLHGNSVKERLQALLFRFQMASLLKWWLKKRVSTP